MSAVVALRPGPLTEVLAVEPSPHAGALADDEVSVRMLAATVNPSDAVTVSGAYGSRTTFPFVPGFEGVGVIERAGAGVPAAAVGLRVLPIGSSGAWQRHKRTGYDWCLPVPEDITDEQACFAYINPVTALVMVDRFCGSGVRRVAITGATSTIAGHLAELLVERGIRPVGLTRGRGPGAVRAPEHWGAVIGTGVPEWPGLLRDATGGRGAEVVFDCVGGEHGESLVRALAPGGVLVHYGLLSGEPLSAACYRAPEGRRVELFRLRDLVHAGGRAWAETQLTAVFAALRAGRLATVPAREVPLTELPASVTDAPSGARGKLLITFER